MYKKFTKVTVTFDIWPKETTRVGQIGEIIGSNEFGGNLSYLIKFADGCEWHYHKYVRPVSIWRELWDKLIKLG